MLAAKERRTSARRKGMSVGGARYNSLAHHLGHHVLDEVSPSEDPGGPTSPAPDRALALRRG